MDLIGQSINRQFLYDLLNQVAPVYSIGQCKDHSVPHMVLKDTGGVQRGSARGRVETYEILCYAPSNSILQLDLLMEQVETILREYDIDITGELGSDYLDTDLDCYMRFIQISIPKEVK